MGFTIIPSGEGPVTTISNHFIKKYMSSANGNYVKVYLLLQMACQHPAEQSDYSVSRLADCLECTENDILRALRYWSKEGLISMREEDGTAVEIRMTSPGSSVSPADTADISGHAADHSAHTKSDYSAPDTDAPAGAENVAHRESAAAREYPVPDKQYYTPLQAEAFLKDEEINRAITSVEQLLGAPVTQAHLDIILYFMCDIGFSAELLVTLYETAVKKGKKKPNYIEAIGISWARQGITTPAQAKEEAAAFSGRYALVSHALGMNRSLAPAERAIIDTWQEYQFADSIIEEACKRTVLQTGDTNLNYVSKILSGWHRNHVISLEDVQKCDEAFKNKKRNRSGNNSRNNKFQNFPQRTYTKDDFSSLEQQLLQGQKN